MFLVISPQLYAKSVRKIFPVERPTTEDGALLPTMVIFLEFSGGDGVVVSEARYLRVLGQRDGNSRSRLLLYLHFFREI